MDVVRASSKPKPISCRPCGKLSYITQRTAVNPPSLGVNDIFPTEYEIFLRPSCGEKKGCRNHRIKCWRYSLRTYVILSGLAVCGGISHNYCVGCSCQYQCDDSQSSRARFFNKLRSLHTACCCSTMMQIKNRIASAKKLTIHMTCKTDGTVFDQ